MKRCVKRHSRNSLHLLIDNEQRTRGGVSLASPSAANATVSNGRNGTGGPSSNSRCYWDALDALDDDDDDEDEDIFSPQKQPRRASYGAPVHFQKVAFYENPGILMIVQSIGSEQGEEKERDPG